jgi:hypothetical protein
MGDQNLFLPFILYYGLFSLLGVISMRRYIQFKLDSLALSKDIGVLWSDRNDRITGQPIQGICGKYIHWSLSPARTSWILFSSCFNNCNPFICTYNYGASSTSSMSSSYGEGDAHAIKKLLYVTTHWLSPLSLFLGGIFITYPWISWWHCSIHPLQRRPSHTDAHTGHLLGCHGHSFS